MEKGRVNILRRVATSGIVAGAKVLSNEKRETLMTPEQKKQIDSMSQYDLCRKWRFAKVGDPLLQGEAGEYFSKVLKEKGGFTPEISKDLGW
jgi:hypothetical protein